MSTVDRNRVAALLDEIGTLLELKGENPFKCRAYHNGARTIGALTQDLGELIASGELKNVKGIGQGLAEKIQEFAETGTMSYYEELKASLPPGLTDMLRIQGLGPKKVKHLYEKLNILSIEALKKAAGEHRLRDLEGFGEKTEENILKGIDLLARTSDKHLISVAETAGERMLAAVKAQKGVRRCQIAGSLRRRKEIIGDIDLLVEAADKDRTAIMKAFVSHADVDQVLAHGETKSSVVLSGGINCDLRIVDAAAYPFALNYFTGSKEHNVRMRSRARDRGWSLNEYGFTRLGKAEFKGKAAAIPACAEEEDIYQALGLAYVPPELREDREEIEAAGKRRLPHLVEESDICGTFHCHTTYSDGSNTVEEMAEAAKARGWHYLGIADHSKAAAYAGGLTESRLKQLLREIEKFNARQKQFRVFAGSEVDILHDGSLDYSDAVLGGLEYVVASIHSKFKMTEAEGTKRIIKALKNRHVTMLGHPTGRLLLSREGYPVDMVQVIDAAADYGTMIEINAHPMRLDIDWRLLRYAKEKRVLVCINPDAHETAGLDDVHYGVGIARKGWLEAADIVNTRTVAEVEKLFARKQGRT